MRLLALLLLCASAPLAAQTDWLPVPDDGPVRQDRRPAVGEWQFALDFGPARFPDGFRARGSRFAVGVERQVHRWVALEADLSCLRSAETRLPGEPQAFVSLCSTVLGGVVPIEVSSRFWPYVRAGYGLALWDEQAREGFYNVDDTSPVAVLGAGVRTYFGREQSVGLRVDFQAQQAALRDVDVSVWSIGFGVSLRVPRG